MELSHVIESWISEAIDPISVTGAIRLYNRNIDTAIVPTFNETIATNSIIILHRVGDAVVPRRVIFLAQSVGMAVVTLPRQIN